MARLKVIESNKPEKYIHSVRNIDAGSSSVSTVVTGTIPQGTPVVLALGAALNPLVYSNGLPAGFEDGLDIVLPVSAANNVNYGFGTAVQVEAFHYGVAIGTILPNALGEVMVHGVYPFALFARATRSASSASWTSSASAAGGVFLSIDTLNNCYTTIASTALSNALSNTPVILLDSLASFSASASATSDTRTVMITQQRVFIREM